MLWMDFRINKNYRGKKGVSPSLLEKRINDASFLWDTQFFLRLIFFQKSSRLKRIRKYEL